MQQRKLELRIVGTDEDGRGFRPTPAEQMGALLRAFKSTFDAMTGEQRAAFAEGAAKLFAPQLQALAAAPAPAAAPLLAAAPFAIQTPVRNSRGVVGHLITETFATRDAL